MIVTDKLKSYGAAKRESLPGIEHRQHRYLYNRAGSTLGSGQVLLKPPAQIPAQPEGREAQAATGIRDSPIVG